ncbi:MAG: hypothetical protein ACPG32_04360 [Akkermansiaceae bacterium]
MKLKLFGKKDKSAAPASAEVEEQENSEGAEGADDSANDESESDGDSGAEESSSDDSGDDQSGDDGDDSTEGEVTQAQMIDQINACTTRIEQQDATISNLQGQLKKLTGDRSKEIDQAASKKAVQQTAAQGVPADEMPDAEGEGSMDEPKTMAEFQTALNGIEDPNARGAYYQKHNSKFFG